MPSFLIPVLPAEEPFASENPSSFYRGRNAFPRMKALGAMAAEVRCDATSILNRLITNDSRLSVLRVGSALMDVVGDDASENKAKGSTALASALLHHDSLRSMIVSPEAYQRLVKQDFSPGASKTRTSTDSWARLMRVSYHLPLRSVFMDALRMHEVDLHAVTLLVSHLCGVEDCGEPRAPRASHNEDTVVDDNSAEVGMRSGTLVRLSLSRNTVSPILAKRLGDAFFSPHSSLRHLNLSHCELGDAGLAALVEGVDFSEQQQGNQKTLQLCWNGITSASDCHIRALLADPALRVQLCGNSLSCDCYHLWREGIAAQPVQEREPAAAAALEETEEVDDQTVKLEEPLHEHDVNVVPATEHDEEESEKTEAVVPLHAHAGTDSVPPITQAAPHHSDDDEAGDTAESALPPLDLYSPSSSPLQRRDTGEDRRNASPKSVDGGNVATSGADINNCVIEGESILTPIRPPSRLASAEGGRSQKTPPPPQEPAAEQLAPTALETLLEAAADLSRDRPSAAAASGDVHKKELVLPSLAEKYCTTGPQRFHLRILRRADAKRDAAAPVEPLPPVKDQWEVLRLVVSAQQQQHN